MKLTPILCLRVGGILLLITGWALPGHTQPDFGPPPPGNSAQESLPQSSFLPPAAPSEGRPPSPEAPAPPLPPIPPSAPNSSSNAQGETAKAELPETISLPEVKYTSEKLPDPFLSPFEMDALFNNKSKTKIEESDIVEEGLEGFDVTGTVWGTKLPQAIVNETVVRVGEVINGALILDIKKEGVYVQYEEKKYLLKTPR